jgi:hypothetical protein
LAKRFCLSVDAFDLHAPLVRRQRGCPSEIAEKKTLSIAYSRVLPSIPMHCSESRGNSALYFEPEKPFHSMGIPAPDRSPF